MSNTGIIHPECADERLVLWQSNNKNTVISAKDFIKILFDIDGVREHMWVQVTDIQGEVITGLLANDPKKITSLKYGNIVVTKRSEIQDLIKHS